MENRKCNYPPRAVLEDGTEIRLVPLELTGGRALYVSKEGQGYSYVRERFRNVQPVLLDSPCQIRRKHRPYQCFRHHKNIYVHRAVLSAWVEPCPPGYEIDHINGDYSDNRLENLEYVTHAENSRRRWVLYAKQGKGFNGKRLTELGKAMLRRHKEYAERHGILVQMEIQFEEAED